VELVPAMSVKARASFVKRIGMGDGVSYGLTWHAAAPTTVVTLPLGYADGVHRVASNRMQGAELAGSAVNRSAGCAWTSSWWPSPKRQCRSRRRGGARRNTGWRDYLDG